MLSAGAGLLSKRQLSHYLREVHADDIVAGSPSRPSKATVGVPTRTITTPSTPGWPWPSRCARVRGKSVTVRKADKKTVMDSAIHLLIESQSSVLRIPMRLFGDSHDSVQRYLSQLVKDGVIADVRSESGSRRLFTELLMPLVFEDLAERDLTARTGGTTRSQLLDLAAKTEPQWPQDWLDAGVVIFTAYMRSGESTAAQSASQLDGIPLLRARMLAYSQHRTPAIARALRIRREALDEYFLLWTEALRNYGRHPTDVEMMVRLLGGLLDGFVLDVSVQSVNERRRRHDEWAHNFSRASLAIVETFSEQID